MNIRFVLHIFLLFVFIPSVVCCSGKGGDERIPGTQDGTEITFSVIPDYYLRNTYVQNDSADLIVFPDKESLSEFTGNENDNPVSQEIMDFQTHLLVGISQPSTRYEIHMQIERIIEKDNKWFIFLSEEQGERQPYSTRPFVLFSVRKSEQPESISLVKDEEIIAVKVL